MNIKDRFIQEPLYLMDGSAFIYRGFYANQNMQRSDGFPTSALFITTRILLRILRKEQPQKFVFFLDGPTTNFRHTLFPLYKAQRSTTPEALIQQIDPIKRLIIALGLCLKISDNCEADDCIASIAERYRDTQPIIIVAADKDLKQCLHKNVIMWDPTNKPEKIITLESFTKEEGVTPQQWPDVQAIIGDSSDNIPGIPGIGIKTATKIFQEFTSLEAIRDNFVNLPTAIQKKFSDHLEAMFLYRELTRLLTTQCEDMTLNTMKVKNIHAQEAITLLREFELASLERELITYIQSSNKNEEHSTLDTLNNKTTHSTPQLLLFDTPKVLHKNHCSKIEELPSFQNERIAMIVSNEDIALCLKNKEYLYTGPLQPIVKKLIEAHTIIIPNLKQLLRTSAIWHTIPIKKWFELSLAAYLLDPEDRDYGWPKLLARWSTSFGLPQGSPALIALMLYEYFYKRLQGSELLQLMYTLELPLIPVLAKMELNGILLNVHALESFLKEVQNDLIDLTKTIYQEAGTSFNIRSSQQLAEILFQQLNLPQAKKTRTGQTSTSQEVLEKLSGHHPIIEKLLEYRKLEKLRSTYLEPLPRLMGKDHRIRTTFNQLATATGRLSSSNPNLQNIPVRGQLGQRMRTCFTASHDHFLISADYSQIELRVLAHYSQDVTLINAFLENADIHTRTASLLYDKEPNDITSDERRNAKTINFGLIYGMGPQKLAQELKITLTNAKEFIQRYFKRLYQVKEFYDQVEQRTKEHGYVTTFAGRKRFLPDINSENTQLQALARRQAINTLIQGSAADIIKIAMITVHSDKQLINMNAQLLLQIHDELVLEIPKDYAEEAGKRVALLMTQVSPNNTNLTVPLIIDWGIGNTWGDAH